MYKRSGETKLVTRKGNGEYHSSGIALENFVMEYIDVPVVKQTSRVNIVVNSDVCVIKFGVNFINFQKQVGRCLSLLLNFGREIHHLGNDINANIINGEIELSMQRRTKNSE